MKSSTQGVYKPFIMRIKHRAIVEIISSLFILLFLYTALSKLLDLERFAGNLYNSPLISKYSSILAWALPIVEIIVSILLFIHKTRKIGLYVSFVLMALFTGYLAYMITYTPHLPCSCGGVLRQMSWKQHLIFNALFTLLAFAGIWVSKQSRIDTKFS